MHRIVSLARLLVFLNSSASNAEQPDSAIQIPGGSAGIGFDDLRYSPSLKRVLVPAGRTGMFVLIDPRTGSAGDHRRLLLDGALRGRPRRGNHFGG
jgi:hypothetical protein